jgi:hypothetical protein
MTARSIRRAAERRAKKEARKAERLAATAGMPTTDDAADLQAELEAAQQALAEAKLRRSQPSSTEQPRPVSAAQLAANRANAERSLGPVTLEGKAISSLNAVKTGLNGRTVLLPTDDVDEYKQHMSAYEAELAPVGHRETDLVRSIAETAWRLKRIPQIESGLYGFGRLALADDFQEHPPAVRALLIQTMTQLRYEKQLRNLHLQESRLVRRREKELAELRTLQQERARREEAAAVPAKQPAPAPDFVRTALQATAPDGLVGNGFEFPTPEVDSPDVPCALPESAPDFAAVA